MAKIIKKEIREKVDKRDRKIKEPIRNKCTFAEYDMRVNVVLEMILSGLRRWQIIKNIETNEDLKKWGVSISQIDNYIHDANEIMKKHSEKTSDEHFKSIYNKLDYLYQKLVHVKDYKGAIVALDKKICITNIGNQSKLSLKIVKGADDLFIED